MAYSKDYLKKKKLISSLQQEIKELEDKINNTKKYNQKILRLRKLKISLKLCQITAPYLICLSITTGVFASFGITPFIFDDCKHKKEWFKDFDTDGNIRYEEQYDEYDDTDNTIIYYDKWVKLDDEYYTRTIRTYDAEYVSNKTINAIIEDKKITSLDELLGKPKEIKQEKRNNLTSEELEKPYVLSAHVYNYDKNDYIIAEESDNRNLNTTFLWLLVTIVIDVIISSNTSGKTLKEYKNDIKAAYPFIDKEILMDRLQIKRDNYKTLTR